MASFNSELQELMQEYQVTETFQTFLKTTVGLKSISDYVWAARNDATKVDTELIDPSGLTGLTIMQKVAIRQSWFAAHTIFSKKADSQKQSPQHDAKISEGDTKTLEGEFFRRHSFKLHARRLLNEKIQGQILAEYNSDPKSFKLILPEKLFMHNAIVTPVGTTLTFVDGQNPRKEDIVVDGVADTVEMWMRLRALLNTIAYVSILRPDWFSYDDAEELADQILSWMNQKYDNRRLSLGFFHSAYISTFQFWFEEIRLRKVTLKSLVKEQSSYRSFWTQATPVNQPAPVKETRL